MLKKISLQGEEVSFSFMLNSRIVVIRGESGSGRTFLFNTWKAYAVSRRNNILFFNYTTAQDLYNVLQSKRDCLFVIDNADILLTDELRAYIAQDLTNQFVIIGRCVDGLGVGRSGLAEVHIDVDKRKGTLVYPYLKKR